MFTAWVVFHVIVCFALIIVVLLQSAKGEGLAGSAFGGGGMGGAVFGGRGAASFLSNATTVLAVVFMANCIALALMSNTSRPVIGAATEDGTTSPITRAAQQEYERSQQAQQQRIADSIAAASGQDTTVSLENLVPTDSN